MNQKTGMISVAEFFKILWSLRKSEFVFKVYFDRDPKVNKIYRVYFEVLVDDDSKLVCKITENAFDQLLLGERAIVEEISLFTSDMIKGNISIRAIMRDARPHPNIQELVDYFQQFPGSIFENVPEKYPLGLACGTVRPLSRQDSFMLIKLEDVSGQFSGKYFLKSMHSRLYMAKTID